MTPETPREADDGTLVWALGGSAPKDEPWLWHLRWTGWGTALCAFVLPDDAIAPTRPLGEWLPAWPCPKCQDVIRREVGL